jgi:hypothetical protein
LLLGISGTSGKTAPHQQGACTALFHLYYFFIEGIKYSKKCKTPKRFVLKIFLYFSEVKFSKLSEPLIPALRIAKSILFRKLPALWIALSTSDLSETSHEANSKVVGNCSLSVIKLEILRETAKTRLPFCSYFCHEWPSKPLEAPEIRLFFIYSSIMLKKRFTKSKTLFWILITYASCVYSCANVFYVCE